MDRMSQHEGINETTLNRPDGHLLEVNVLQEANVNPDKQNRCNSNLPVIVITKISNEQVSDHANDQQRDECPIIVQSINTDSIEHNNNSGLGDPTNTEAVANDSDLENGYYITDEEDIAFPFMKLFTCLGKKAKPSYTKLGKKKSKEPHIDPFRQTQWKLLNTTNERDVIPRHPYIQQVRVGGMYSPGMSGASADTILQIGKTDSGNVNTLDRPVEVSSGRESLFRNNDVLPYTLSNSDQYDFSHPHRGYAIVIVNQCFTRFYPRNGADVDLLKTRELLQKLGYFNKNIERHNLDKESTLAILQDAKDTDHSKMDSFALIFSSHGHEMEHPRSGKNEHVIYCSDDQYIFTNDILEMFSDKNCPSLKGKPKLFFIQACRGDKTDDGAQIGIQLNDRNAFQEQSNSHYEENGSRSHYYVKNPHEETLKPGMNIESESGLLLDRVQYVDDTDGRRFEDISEDRPIVNCNNDCLVMYAAPSGHCAWRSNEDGSWMLHYLWLEVMSYDYRKPCSFLKILTAVNRKMSDRETNVPDKPLKSCKKAIPVIIHQLDKDIVFKQKIEKYVGYTKTTVTARS
ncbi:hypothetical protein ACJMK2_033285 [Sinanodonta woodiana]|uniref:Uncharacterized protein n=1 Tax=Sinanodonta woodiana TaxID=1069815 RepID=A0ABD3WNC1_SINWO